MTGIVSIFIFALYCLNIGFVISGVIHRQKEDGVSGAFLRGVGVLVVQLLASYLGIRIIKKGLDAYLFVMSISSVLFFIISLILHIIGFKKNRAGVKEWLVEKRKNIWYSLAILFTVAIVAFFIIYYEPATNGDFTVEITQSILGTKDIQTNAWLTGIGNSALERETTHHTLPAFYAFISWVFGVKPYILIWRGIPLLSLFIYTAILFKWAEFFVSDEDKTGVKGVIEKRILPTAFLQSFFVCVNLIILLFMDYSYMAYGYRFLHAGWQESTLFTHLFVPLVTLMAVSGVYTMLQKRGKHV